MNEEVKELLRCLRNFFANTCGVRHQLAKRTIDTITRLSAKQEPEEVKKLFVEANEWIQSKVKREGGLVGCRDGNLCIACRLSAYVEVNG